MPGNVPWISYGTYYVKDDAEKDVSWYRKEHPDGTYVIGEYTWNSGEKSGGKESPSS